MSALKTFSRVHAATLLLAGALLMGFANRPASANLVLYSEDFTGTAGAFDAGTDGARDTWTYNTTPTGAATSATRLQSIDTDGFQQITASNQWSLKEVNSASGDGLFFQDITQSARTHFNWATSSYAADILNGGGIKITFDVAFSDVADNNNWIEFSFGTGNAFSTDGRRYDDADVDFGFRFEGDRYDAKDNHVSVETTGFTGLSNNIFYPAEVTLSFDSFAAGSSVDATAKINGNSFTHTFTWDTANDFSFSFGPGAFVDEDFVTVDNLVISTIAAIPEASQVIMLLSGFTAVGVTIWIRRRQRVTIHTTS